MRMLRLPEPLRRLANNLRPYVTYIQAAALAWAWWPAASSAVVGWLAVLTDVPPVLVVITVVVTFAAVAASNYYWQRSLALSATARSAQLPPPALSAHQGVGPPTRKYTQIEKEKLLELLFQLSELFNNDGLKIRDSNVSLVNDWITVEQAVRRGTTTLREDLKFAFLEIEAKRTVDMVKKFNTTLFEPSMARRFSSFTPEIEFVFGGLTEKTVSRVHDALEGFATALNWLKAAVLRGDDNAAIMPVIQLVHDRRAALATAGGALRNSLLVAIERCELLRARLSGA